MNELLPFSDSFIKNETQSNEILHNYYKSRKFDFLYYGIS